MRIALATEGPRLGPAALAGRPLGGVETALALLAAALLARGHELDLRAGTEPPETRDGLPWRPLAPASLVPGGPPAELVIANRLPRLFRTLPPGRRVLWLHNPGGYLRKPRHLLPLLAARPRLVTLGPSHSASLPWLLPFRPVEIPLALAPPFDAGAAPAAAARRRLHLQPAARPRLAARALDAAHPPGRAGGGVAPLWRRCHLWR